MSKAYVRKLCNEAGDHKANIPADVPLVTYVTRCFEPYRGWPQVAEGLALLMQRNPRAHVLLVGSDEVAYGAKRGDGMTWREWALKQWPMDPSRLHQLPALSYDNYKLVIQRSWVHVYWTVPFILSWSLMESMASGCCIIASATPLVEEVITSGDQGQLVDFFDPDALAQQADHLLQNQEKRQQLGQAARQLIFERGYDLQTALKRQVQLINRLFVADTCNPIECNRKGLEQFAAGNPEAADLLLRQAYRNLSGETGILVNLGLALMQQGLVDQAERAYRLALDSDEQRVRRSAAKNLGFLLLWRGDHQQGWHWHSQRFEGEGFEANQWRGDPLNGKTLTVWNDVGMGDAFQFVRYTFPLIERGEHVRFAVAESQVPLFETISLGH